MSLATASHANATAAAAHAAARAKLHGGRRSEGFGALVDDDSDVQATQVSPDASSSAKSKPKGLDASSADNASPESASLLRGPGGVVGSGLTLTTLPIALTGEPIPEDVDAPQDPAPGVPSTNGSPTGAPAQAGLASTEIEVDDGAADEPLAEALTAPSTGPSSAAASQAASAPRPSQTAATTGGPAAPLLGAATAAGATLVQAQAVPAQAVPAQAAPAQVAANGRASQRAAAPSSGGSDPSAAKSSAPPPPASTTPLGATPADPTLVVLAATSAGADSGDSDPDDAEGGQDPATPSLAAEAGLGAQGFAPLTGETAASAQTYPAGAPLSASAADLAAQVAAKVNVGASRFTLSLNPLGLGQVDVTVSIGADRQLTASLAFSDPQTAHVLSAHAGELKGALEQAGFSVPQGGFDFTSAASATPSGPNAGNAGLGGGFGGTGERPQDGARAARAAFNAGEALGHQNSAGDGAWTSNGDSRLDIRI